MLGLLISVLAKPMQLYTKGKGKGLYAATHHFFTCKSYGTTIVIVTAQLTPTILLQLNLYNTLLLCLQVELYTKGNGLYAANHHFFACKSYGTTISILLQPNQPQLYCYSSTCTILCFFACKWN